MKEKQKYDSNTDSFDEYDIILCIACHILIDLCIFWVCVIHVLIYLYLVYIWLHIIFYYE